jgi:hypothetical protein
MAGGNKSMLGRVQKLINEEMTSGLSASRL